MIRGDSPRMGHGNDTLEGLLRDYDLRISMLERAYIGSVTVEGVTAVADATQLPDEPNPNDRALDLGTGQVYTADAAGVWQLGGTIP